MTLETRRLGSQGPSLTTIGFGTWAIGGAGWEHSWGPQNDQDSIEAVHVALDEGINWFDTAAAYGLGHAEMVLGRALGNRRKDIVLATKFGLVWDDAGHIVKNGSYASVLREADASLRRLGTDYIDLYQMHWPDVETRAPIEETMRALDDLVPAGKVRYVGVSNFDVPLLQRAMAVRRVDSLQPPYNLLTRQAEDELLPFCREHGIGVVAYSPLASGLLGGRYTTSTTFDPGDWRSRDPRFTGDGLRHSVEIVNRLKEIAARSGRTVAQLAIAWVLSNPAVTSAIVGARRPEHIRSALPAAGWHLDAETLHEIDAVLEARQPEAATP